MANEAHITVNGVPLTMAQSMTLRVALGYFSIGIHSDGCGNDEHGKILSELYLKAADEIGQLMRGQ